jgi:hypothetical protein
LTAPITWAEATSPIYWSNIGINWNSPAKGESPSFAVDAGYATGGALTIGSSVLYGVDAGLVKSGTGTIVADAIYAVNTGYTALGGFTLNVSADFDISLDETSTGILTNAVASASYDLDAGYINNTKYPESMTFDLSMTYSNGDSLLWNDVSDPSSTWSDVSDPSTTWSDVSDPSTIWTRVDYPH